jgi:hypothetical protein
MSNRIRLEIVPRTRLANVQPPGPRPLPPMLPAEARQPAPEPAAARPEEPGRHQVRQGVLEHVYFDGPMQLELWWEGEGLPHPGAIELR